MKTLASMGSSDRDPAVLSYLGYRQCYTMKRHLMACSTSSSPYGEVSGSRLDSRPIVRLAASSTSLGLLPSTVSLLLNFALIFVQNNFCWLSSSLVRWSSVLWTSWCCSKIARSKHRFSTFSVGHDVQGVGRSRRFLRSRPSQKAPWLLLFLTMNLWLHKSQCLVATVQIELKGN